MNTDSGLIEWYMRGFGDELKGTTSTVSDSFMENQAYKLGATHALLGDDVSSFDKKTDDEILMEIKDPYENMKQQNSELLTRFIDNINKGDFDSVVLEMVNMWANIDRVHPSLISSAKIATQYQPLQDGLPTIILTNNIEGINNHGGVKDMHDKFGMFLKGLRDK